MRLRNRLTLLAAGIILPVLVLAAFSASRPDSADAHPLGNFTVNRHSLVQPSGERVYVRYVLDMAEIPTYQSRPAVAAEGVGA